MPRHHHTQLLAGLIVAAMAGAGCGSDSEPASKTASKRPATVDLDTFLMRNGEEPGFRRVDRGGTDSFDAFAKNVTREEERALRRAGFISITFQPIEGRGARGISNVQLFKTAKGAQDTLDHELRTDVIRSRLPGAKVRHFTVPGIPGARGWTSPAPGHPVGNVHWVQGRCMLVLGNQGPGPLAERLSTGARAIHERTKGQCPDAGGKTEPMDLAALVGRPTLAGIASVKGLDVRQHDDPHDCAIANTWVYNAEPSEAFEIGKRLEGRGFVADAVHYYGHEPGVTVRRIPWRHGYRSLIQFADADGAKKEARDQMLAARNPCPNEACATSRRVVVTGVPGATGTVLTRDVDGERRYEYVVVFTKGGVVGQVWVSSVTNDLDDEITSAAQDLYGSIPPSAT